jgi:flagellin
MAMVINTNIGSENAIRLLDKSGRSQSVSMERLTSGQRINGANDDAAGLAITTGMTAQIRGTDQAVRNANDAMSLIQTADGASEEIVNMLQRQRELAIQSLNGTYNAENRSQMDTEFQQLTSEINRVAGTTKFNEVNLMANLGTKGSFLSAAASNRVMQVGWEVAGLSATNKMTVSMGNFWTGVSGNTGVFGQATITAANGSKVVVNSAFSKASIGTTTAASQAVMKIDSALSNIGTLRAKWGALQNRLEYTVSNLQNVNENMMNARSRIQDTDYARESANLARTQVLQQAGMSMLSQANQSGQNVMSLLR